jgi:TRAP transporter 4TM/12TM fusion protein
LTWAIDLWIQLGFTFYDEQALIACVGLALAIIFIRYPILGGKQRPLVPWYDALLAIAALAAAGFFIFKYGEITENPFAARPLVFGIALVFLPLVWEALRRSAGWSLVVIFSTFIAYGFVGHLMPGLLKGVEQRADDLIGFLGTSEVAILGLPLKIIVLTVVLFIWMGQLLLFTGASEWFTELAAAMMGRSRGGSAKIAIMASGLFGSISGSAVANVASTGVITIPLMRQAGYSATTAGAIEAVASTGGQIMPPVMGAAAFLMAELLELSYTDIIIAALIPAFLYYLAVFVQADLEAAKNKIAPLRPDQIPPISRVMREGWFFIVPFAVLVYTLFFLNMSAPKSAFWSAIAVATVSIVFGYKGKRITPMQLWSSITETGRSSADVIVIGAMAGVIIGVLDKTGLGQALTLILSAVGQDNLWVLLGLTAVISIILGMGMPTSAIYLLLATMIAPSLVKLGVHPIAAHMFVLYFGLMSMITPPVALAAFAAASLAGAPAMATGMTAVRLGWIAYIIPFVFVLSPALLMQGDAIHIVTAAVTAVAGVWITSCGFVGWLMRPINPAIRVLVCVAGIALLLPAHRIPFGIEINVGGALLGAACIAWQAMLGRNRRNLAEAAKPAE